MRFEHTPFPHDGLLDARPVRDGWATLRQDGPLDVQGLVPPLELHVSHDGAFSAVVERFGQRGRVFQGHRAAMELDRDEYCADCSVFPAAFFERGGRTLFVHGTDWNRLDVSDPATGELLTPRGPTSYAKGEPQPEHYLDYFHAGLHVSPDGRWIAEDGWTWHPLGELRVWSLDDWLERNPWESEDGPSMRSLDERVYFWDTPILWLDKRRLAFWGEGDDATRMKPTVRIYDVVEGREVAAHPGVEVSPALPWPPGSARAGWIAADRWLYGVSPEHGTGVWDLRTGERVHLEEGFAPRRHHPLRGSFLSWDEAGAFESRLVT